MFYTEIVTKLLSRLFIPQRKNNYKAILAQPGFLAIFLCLYLLNQSIIRSISIAHPGVLGFSSEITSGKVFNQTNQERLKLGLEPLRFSQTLSKSAQAKAEHMFANNYWAHNAPDGTTPWDFFKDVNYQYLIAGENLAKDFYDTSSMMSAWMKSPTHRDNIVNPKYKEIGIGVVNGTLSGVKTTLVVQHFGTPLNDNLLSPVTPPPELLVQGEQTQLPSKETTPVINPLSLSKLIGGSIFSIMVVVLFIDGLVTLKRGNNRLSGSASSQVAFLLIILILLIFTKQGAIF